MYSEIAQKLDTHELELMVDSLEFSASTHIRWVSKINQSLVCHDKTAEPLCSDDPPHIHCQFTQWRNGITNKAILDDPLFKKLTISHEQLHFKACSLEQCLSEKQSISAEEYSEFTEVQFDFFRLLSSLTKECTEALWVIDALTKLPNRRAFEEILLQEENRIKRNNITSVIAAVGIDNFKAINDTHGRLAGDLLLIQLASLFKNSLRNFDTVARYSGDKFILYLPDIGISSAKIILQRLRGSIENTKLEIDADTYINLTCTFGLVQLDSNTASADSLPQVLSSLEEAQLSGKNNVVLSNH